MTKLTISLFALMLLASVGFAESNKEEQKPDSPVVLIGTYDSRSIAVAFVGSDVFNQHMAGFQSQHDMAKLTGDTKIMAKLEAEAAARQKKLHKQAFSTAPVDDILGHITDQLPDVKEQAGVGVLLSKWDRKKLAKYKSLEQVNVTMLLVEAFKPSDRQKMRAVEIQKQSPAPLDKMKDLKH